MISVLQSCSVFLWLVNQEQELRRRRFEGVDTRHAGPQPASRESLLGFFHTQYGTLNTLLL